MFIQVIQGKTSDREGLKRQFQRWDKEIRPGAIGFVNSTFGVTADGTCIGFACFENAETAMKNSNRPEQTAWWNETEKYYDGPVTFHDSNDVESQLGGPDQSAGFVQAMQGTISDRSKLKQIETKMEQLTKDMRPDLLGTIGCYYGNNEFTSFAYFTSESEARKGESQPTPDDVAATLNEWQQVMAVNSWFDITDPWFSTKS